MTDQCRLDMIQWHGTCAGLLMAGLDDMPDPPCDDDDDEDEDVLEDEVE